MKEYRNHNETGAEALEVVDTARLPSLDDLMREFEASEADSSQTAPAPEKNAAPRKSINPFEAELIQTRERLLALEQERDEVHAAFRTLKGNFDKYRWRAERERAENYTFAVVSIIQQFLPILDNFERALVSAQKAEKGETSEHFVSGINLIYLQTMKYLENLGATRIPTVGEAFNPQFHEAVSTEIKPDLPPNTIIEEVLRGYRMGDKLIRAAMVKVSTAG